MRAVEFRVVATGLDDRTSNLYLLPWARTARFFVSLIALLVPASAGPKQPAPEPSVLIRRATELSDIWSTGQARLRMRVKFLAVKAGTIDADYEKVSASSNQWRVSISSPEFNGVTVGGQDRVWESSDASDTPLRMWQFERALAGLSQSVVSDRLEYVVRYRRLEGRKDKVPCVQVQDGRHSVQDCFDTATGALLSAQEGSWTYVYSGYQPFGVKLFPRTITVFEAFTLVAMAQVVELENPATLDPQLFEPLPEVKAYSACREALGIPLGATGGKLVHEVRPTSPRLPGGSGILSNDMVVSAILGRDGKLHNVSVGGTNPQTRDATSEAVQQWQFEPFNVCGNPVEMPVSFTMNFSNRGEYIGRFGP